MKLKLKGIFKDYMVTLFSQGLIVLSFFFTLKLIGRKFGAEGVGEFSLLRRNISFLNTFLWFGLGIGLPRYLSLTDRKEIRADYIKAAGLVIIGLSLLTIGVFNIFDERFSEILFGSAVYRPMILPFSFLLLAYSFESLFYCTFQGLLQVRAFNVLRMTNMAVLPFLVVVLVRTDHLDRYVLVLGIASLLSSLAMGSRFLPDILARTIASRFKTSFWELMRYSLPRIPAELIFVGFFSLGPLIAIHFTDMREVGFLSVSQTLLYTIGAVFAPMSVLFLPKVGILMRNKREDLVKSSAEYIIEFVLYSFVFATVQLMIFAELIMKMWLGPEFVAAVPALRVTFLSIVFYGLYISMRSIIDASRVKPINLINLVVSFGVFLGISGVVLFGPKIVTPAIGLAAAFTGGLTTLGILTFVSVHKICTFDLKNNLRNLAVSLCINAVFGALAIAVKSLLHDNLVLLIAYALIASVLYLAVLWVGKVHWVRRIRDVVFHSEPLSVP